MRVTALLACFAAFIAVDCAPTGLRGPPHDEPFDESDDQNDSPSTRATDTDASKSGQIPKEDLSAFLHGLTDSSKQLVDEVKESPLGKYTSASLEKLRGWVREAEPWQITILVISAIVGTVILMATLVKLISFLIFLPFRILGKCCCGRRM